MSDKTPKGGEQAKVDMRVAEHLQHYADAYERIIDIVASQLEKQIKKFDLPQAVVPSFIQRGIEMTNDAAIKFAITIEANKDNLAIKSLDSTSNFVGMTTQGTGELNSNLTELYFKLLESVIFRAGIDFIPPETPRNKEATPSGGSGGEAIETTSIPDQSPPSQKLRSEDLRSDIRKQFVLYQREMRHPYPQGNMPRELMAYFKKHQPELSEEMQGFVSMLLTYLVGFSDEDKNELYPGDFSAKFLKGRAVAKTIIRRSQKA